MHLIATCYFAFPRRVVWTRISSTNDLVPLEERFNSLPDYIDQRRLSTSENGSTIKNLLAISNSSSHSELGDHSNHCCIDYRQAIRSLVRIMPLKPLALAISHVFKRTFTIKYHYVMLKPPERCAGRHKLLIERCSSCTLCAFICPTKAIKLVTTDETSREYPQIDYGKCCFCQLCVEICTKSADESTKMYELADVRKYCLLYPPQQLASSPRVSGGRKTVSVKFQRHGSPSHG